MLETVVDNDIVEKLCRWNSVDNLSECLETDPCYIGYLGSLRFVVGKRLNRMGLSAASEQLDQFLQSATEIDLSESELEFAASILEFSDNSDLEFDVGESILFSVGILRQLQSVVTGDKRAICSCTAIAEEFPVIKQLKGHLVSLEQVLGTLVKLHGQNKIRSRVCSDVTADKATNICFACSATTISEDDAIKALSSYQFDLAQKSGEFTHAGLCCLPQKDSVRFD